MNPSRQSLAADVQSLLVVAWLLVVNNLFNIGVNVADTVMAGRLRATQLAAVAPAQQIVPKSDRLPGVRQTVNRQARAS